MKSALRLRSSADFARVRRRGRLYRHSLLMLGVCANGLTHNRYGIVTSRRLGIAVVRNRSKRRLRAALCQLHCGLRQGYDIVVIARPRMTAQPWSALLRSLGEMFARARLRD